MRPVVGVIVVLLLLSVSVTEVSARPAGGLGVPCLEDLMNALKKGTVVSDDDVRIKVEVNTGNYEQIANALQLGGVTDPFALYLAFWEWKGLLPTYVAAQRSQVTSFTVTFYKDQFKPCGPPPRHANESLSTLPPPKDSSVLIPAFLFGGALLVLSGLLGRRARTA